MQSVHPLYEARLPASNVLLPPGRTTSTGPTTRVVGVEEPVRPRGRRASDLGLHRCLPRRAPRRPTDRERLPSGRRCSSAWRASIGPTYASMPAMGYKTFDDPIVPVFHVEEGVRPRGRSTSDLPAARCIRVGAPRRPIDRVRLPGERAVSSERIHLAARPANPLPPSGRCPHHDGRVSVRRPSARVRPTQAAHLPTRACAPPPKATHPICGALPRRMTAAALAIGEKASPASAPTALLESSRS